MTDTKREPSAIRSVRCYVASPVETCDRCAAGIKYVTVVTYADGLRAKFGSECINKILSGDTSLKKLYDKNVKLLKKYTRYLEILSLPFDEMPAEFSYYDRGFYMVTDDDGKAILLDHYFFHPTKVDADKLDVFDGRPTFDMRPFGPYGAPYTLENWTKKCTGEIEDGKAHLTKEIARIGGFLARVLAKASAAKPAPNPLA